MKFQFQPVKPRQDTDSDSWQSWQWQMKSSLKTESQFAEYFSLSEKEKKAFALAQQETKPSFRFQTTPYYASLADAQNPDDPIRKILIPVPEEWQQGSQQQEDPLGENAHRPAKRVIHRYSDRALFLITDLCSVYCRYCTRKHFTASDQFLAKSDEYQEALAYFRNTTCLREVILSGGDPLTLSDSVLNRVLKDLREIEHIEIIRIGSRMPVVCPMRVTPELAGILREYAPVFVMTHFNHPKELTEEAALAISTLVDRGIPVFNQMVLLNGVNNHAAIVQALSRRLLYLRVKPYYAFQCDPSQGTDHLRTHVDQTLQIQRELWGHLSGLAMPNFSLDIPSGGGKVPLVPDFLMQQSGDTRKYRGWDGIEEDYVSPLKESMKAPVDMNDYLEEWQNLKSFKSNDKSKK